VCYQISFTLHNLHYITVTYVILQADELDMTQTDLARDYVSGCKVSVRSQKVIIFNHIQFKFIIVSHLQYLQLYEISSRSNK